MKDELLPVVTSRHSGKSMQILEGNWGKYLQVSLTHVEVVHSQAFSNSRAWVRDITVSWFVPHFSFKRWNATPGEGGRWIWESWWSFSGAIQISWRWKSEQLQKLLQFVLFTSESPPKKDTVPWILPIHFKTNFVLEFFEVDHFFPPLSIWGGFPWGDLEHTHLVKGLDFALLNKVRAELNKQKKVEEVQSLGSCVRFLFFLRPSAKGMGFYVFWRVNLVPPKLQVMCLDR